MWHVNLGLAPQALCLRLLSQAKKYHSISPFVQSASGIKFRSITCSNLHFLVDLNNDPGIYPPHGISITKLGIQIRRNQPMSITTDLTVVFITV
jgi:hypothetical protein